MFMSRLGAIQSFWQHLGPHAFDDAVRFGLGACEPGNPGRSLACLHRACFHWTACNRLEGCAGAKFVKSGLRSGVLPSILAALMSARNTARASLKQLDAGAGSDTDAQRAVLDSRQKALKLAANALYGFTGVAAAEQERLQAASAAVLLAGARLLACCKATVGTAAWMLKKYAFMCCIIPCLRLTGQALSSETESAGASPCVRHEDILGVQVLSCLHCSACSWQTPASPLEQPPVAGQSSCRHAGTVHCGRAACLSQ